MNFFDALNKRVIEERGEEIIDGCKVEDAAKCVDLSVAHSPVVAEYVGTKDVEAMLFNHRLIPEPIKPRKDGLRYYVTNPRAQTWQWFTSDEMKVARARFLLLRSYFYKRLGAFPNGDQQMVLAWYFEGGVWRPTPGSSLGDLMGVVV
ncbi:MAG TPA: hypothetical protein VGN72_05020 [Tepidisphaeraceae bacterium]|jgi:hypothetical protein|nr:hypothetical protein [Tepidisphaeraceae bacterium]